MQRIMVATDLAMRRDVALERGCEIAAENCAALHILRLACRPRKGLTERPQDYATLPADLQKRFPSIAVISMGVIETRQVCTILAHARNRNADLIVMRGEIDQDQVRDRPYDLIIDVARRTATPVLAVQAPTRAPYRRLLALLDHGSDARRVLDLALRIRSASEVFAVHACPARAATDQLDAARKELERVIEATLKNRCDVGATVTPLVGRGDVSSVLIEQWSALQPDLVVAATHPPHGLAGIFRHSHVAELLEIMPFDLLITNLKAGRPQAAECPGQDDEQSIRTALPALTSLLTRTRSGMRTSGRSV